MKSGSLTAIIFLLVLSSCSVVSPDNRTVDLAGEWEWIYSSGTIGGIVITPDSAGQSDRLRTYHRSVGQFFEFRNDTLAWTGRYETESVKEDIRIRYDVPGIDLMEQRIFFRGPDTLILMDECSDCFISTWIRNR